MPRLVALEWDSTEARLLVARVRSGHVDLEHALTVPRGEARSSAEFGAKIQETLKQCSATGLDAIVAVGRSNIELRFLTVPPVPTEELPDLVRMLAIRQFSQPIEEGLLDFAPLASSGSPPTSVLAAAITAELLKTIRDVCEAAGLVPKHLVLRPFAADSLVTDRLRPESCIITVDRLAEEVDLTVVLGGQAVFPRSVRVGNYGTAEDQATNIVAEMRRTIAAAQNQIAGHPVESVLILGSETEQKVLAETIVRELSLVVEFVDPLEAVQATPAVRSSLPGSVARFAPLVGALLDESRSRRHEIDFLAPRKRPAPPNRRRSLAVIGSLAATVLLLGFGYVWWQLRTLRSETAELTEKSKQIDKLLKAAKPNIDRATLIDEWQEGQVVWLEELKELATDLPPGDKVILDELNASVSGKPKIVILGGAVNQSDVPALELKLGDDRHNVRGVGTGVVPANAPYSWSFRETIEFEKPSESAAKPASSGTSPQGSTKASPKSAPAGRKS